MRYHNLELDFPSDWKPSYPVFNIAYFPLILCVSALKTDYPFRSESLHPNELLRKYIPAKPKYSVGWEKCTSNR